MDFGQKGEEKDAIKKRKALKKAFKGVKPEGKKHPSKNSKHSENKGVGVNNTWHVLFYV